MLETFFIDYTNQSLSEDIENIKHIMKPVIQLIDFKIPTNYFLGLDNITALIPALAKLKDPLEARKACEEFKRDSKGKYDLNMFDFQLDIAYNAVYGYTMLDCDKTCIIGSNSSYAGIVSKDRKIQCYECYQHICIHILSRIAEFESNKDIMKYSGEMKIEQAYYADKNNFVCSIPYLEECIWKGYSLVRQNAKVNKEGKIFQTGDIDWPGFNDIGDSFNMLIFGLFGFSLGEYLKEYDISKIKRCKNCHSFFIAETKRREYCDDRCRNEFHRNKTIL